MAAVGWLLELLLWLLLLSVTAVCLKNQTATINMT